MKIYSDETLQRREARIREEIKKELGDGRWREGYAAGYEKATADIKQTNTVHEDDVAFSFNFWAPGICVLSIERIRINTDDEKTQITYYKNTDMKEWFFECTRAQHNKIIEDWNRSRNGVGYSNYLPNNFQATSGRSGLSGPFGMSGALDTRSRGPS